MTSRAHKPLILILLVILVALMGSALWIVQRGLQSEEARVNPTVVQITPRAGAPVSRATTMEFVFDQQMDHASVEQALTLSPPFEYDLLWDDEGGGEQLIIQPRRALAWDTTYRAQIGTTAQNVEGRPLLEGAQVEVQTASAVHVSEVLPAPKSDAIDPRQPITIRFDRPLVEVASLEEQSQLPQPILITPPIEGTGRWIEPDLYGFYPTKGLARGTAYEVTVSPLVAPGNELPETFEWSFVTEGPRLEATFPYDGATEVANATAIRLLFAQPMDRDSVTENFRLSRAEEPTPIAGEYRWEDDHTLLFVPRHPLDAASEYQIRISEGATTQGGTRGLLSPYRAVFTTVDFLRAESVQPAPGSIEVSTVPTDTALTVQFNHPVVALVGEAAQGAMPAPLQISPALEGQGEWVTTSLYRFRPSEPLEPSTEYVVTVDSDLQDTLGSYQDETYSWSFTTEFPRVIRVEPSNPRRHVPAEGPIALRFNQPMNQTSAEAAFSLTGPAGAVSGRIRWVEGGTVLRFIPDQPLTREGEYTLTLAAGARGAKGGESREPFTAPIVAAPELRVISVYPAPGQQEVNVYDGIQITFNTALDPATWDPAQPLPALKPYITIEPAPKGTLGSCCYDAETLTLSIYAENGFTPNTDYTVTVQNIRDESGQTLEPYSWHFRTGALPPILNLASQSAGVLATYSPFAPALQLINYQAISRLDFSLYRVDEATLLRLLTDAERWEAWSQYRGDPAALVEQWSVQPEDASEQMTLHTERLPPDGSLETGVYFFHVGTPERNEYDNSPIQTQQLLAVTSVNLTLKHAANELLLWAVDMESGKPLPNMRLRVFSESNPGTDNSTSPQSGQLVTEGTTDDEGLLRVPLGEEVLSTQTLLALAYDAAGSVVGLAADGLSGFAFDQTRLRIPNNPLPPMLYGTLYTERPIYRPGQTVYFRGILREWQGSALVQPTLSEVTLNIQGADGSILESRAVELSPFGTFYGEFALDEDAPTGQYILNLSQSDLQRCYSPDYCEPETLYAFFNVAEYEVPEYEVEVRAEPKSVVSGEPASATVSANYYAGGALSGAPVEWRLYSRPYAFSVPGLSGYWTWQAYDTPPYFEPVNQPSIGRSGSGTLDAAGQATLPISTELIWQSDLTDPATPGKALSSQRFTIETDVKDLNNKTISGRDELVVHAGDFYIGLRPEGFMGQTGQPMTIHVATADIEGTLEGGHGLTLELSAREYYNVRDTGNPFGWSTHFTDTLVSTDLTSTGEDGFATVTFTPQAGGSYTVLARGTDARGNEVVSRAFFWVSSSNYVNWEQNGDNYIGLIADKTEYQVGDVARILVPTPYEGMSALITQERFGLDAVQVRELATTSETIEVPITEEMIPNMIVSVVAARGVTDETPLPVFRVGYLNLHVSRAPKLLNVTLARPDGASGPLQPGQEATFLLRVTDHAGEPVQGELSLAVVDKAVLALSEEKATPLADVFWSERPNTVRSGSTFMSNLDRLAEGQAPSDGGMGGGGGGFFLGSIRENIQDTAFWRGDIVTDERGEATVTFTLPDNLTIWVLTARVVTEGEPLIGEATIESTSTLPFFVRPTLPRFFVVGDEAEIQVAVHNNTARTINSTVTFEASGLRLRDGEASQPLSIGAGERRVVTFPVTVQEGEAVTVSIAAEGDGFSDALRETLPVYQLSAPEVIASSGLLRPGEGGAVESILLPQESDTTQGELTLELTPSLAGATENTLAWLADFPYPSVEAVASTMLPNVATARALNELGWARPELEAALDEGIRADVALLASWQNMDGGWGWWQGSESQTWLSAYTALSLHEAAQAGFPVPDETLSGATGFLQSWLARTSELQDNATLETRAFVLYVLSERGAADVARTVELFDRHSLLGVAGRAFLLLALDNAGGQGDKVQTLASELTATAILSATGAHWEEETIQPQTLGSSTRSTALAIRALVRVQPEHLLLPQAVRWLMQTRQSGHWETTQESAWSLLALTDFLLASGEMAADFAYEVALNGKVVLSERASPDAPDEATTLEVGITELLLGQANELIITRVPESGEGRLYYSAWLRYFLPAETLEARNEGISVARRYEAVDSATLESTGAPVDSVAVGDIVEVRLTVDAPNDLYFFTLEDPIPAGFEVLDPSLLTTVQGVPAPAQARVDERGPFWFDQWSSHIIRDEKVALFADRLPRGTYEYTYFLRATVPGTFNVLPTVAYEQYHPEVFGRSEGTTFSVAR